MPAAVSAAGGSVKNRQQARLASTEGGCRVHFEPAGDGERFQRAEVGAHRRISGLGAATGARASAAGGCCVVEGDSLAAYSGACG